MRARTSLLASILAVSSLLVGCTTTAIGNPAPGDEPRDSATSEPATTSPTASETNRYGAPDVPAPLEYSRFLTDPCAMLSDDQLSGFSVTKPGLPRTNGPIAKNVGPGCSWITDADGFGVSIIIGNPNGLADLYRVREKDAYFEEVTVNGYPGVFHERIDLRDRGNCSLAVGITNSVTILSHEQGRMDAQRACTKAKDVAAAVLDTLKGA